MVRGMDQPEDVASRLLTPARLFTRAEVLGRPSPVPAAAGVYAWYFDDVPDRVPVDGCRTADGHTLLYVGISPKAAQRRWAEVEQTDVAHKSQVPLSGQRLWLDLAADAGITPRRGTRHPVATCRFWDSADLQFGRSHPVGLDGSPRESLLGGDRSSMAPRARPDPTGLSSSEPRSKQPIEVSV